MKKIVTFLLAIILLLGACSGLVGFIAPKVISKADAVTIDNVSQEIVQEDSKQNTNENVKEDEKVENNLKEANIIPFQNSKRSNKKIEKRKFTDNKTMGENNSNVNDSNSETTEDVEKTNDKVNKNGIIDANNSKAEVGLRTLPKRAGKKDFRTNTLNEQQMELCVIGKASKSVSPDYAKITAVIETLDSDMVKSKDSNFSTFEKVLEALKAQGIAEEDIILESYTSYPSYDYNSGKSLVGYYTITTFTFNVDNLDNIKNYVDVATENGVTSIRNINYELSNMDEVYQDVLMMAIDNAKEKAEKICGEEVAIKSVKEEYVYSCTSLYRNYNENLSQSLMGCIDVEARVSVEFE